jgi:hypothetical protein
MSTATINRRELRRALLDRIVALQMQKQCGSEHLPALGRAATGSGQ